jgi:hypothetical protein
VAVLKVSITELVVAPNSHIVLNASTGDFFVAIKAKLDIKIETMAADTGAASAKPIFLGVNFII